MSLAQPTKMLGHVGAMPFTPGIMTLILTGVACMVWDLFPLQRIFLDINTLPCQVYILWSYKIYLEISFMVTTLPAWMRAWHHSLWLPCPSSLWVPYHLDSSSFQWPLPMSASQSCRQDPPGKDGSFHPSIPQPRLSGKETQ